MARRPDKSIITATVFLRVQALVTSADGGISLPKGTGNGGSRKASGRAYVQSLFDKTPAKPKLEVLAIKKERVGTTVQIGVTTKDGEKISEFTIKGELTEANAGNTGASIARLLGDTGAASMCGRQLLELAQQPGDGTVAFRLGDGGRLQITSGGE